MAKKVNKRKQIPPHVKLLADKTYEWPEAEELGIEIADDIQAIVDRVSSRRIVSSRKIQSDSVRAFHEMYRYFVEGMGINPQFNKGLELEISELHSDKDLGYGDDMTVRVYESLARFIVDWSDYAWSKSEPDGNLQAWRTWFASELAVLDKAIEKTSK